MKISYRILIINFVIVVLVLGSSALAFYSIMYKVLSSQQSKYLTNSANIFIYTYRGYIQDCEDQFNIIAESGSGNYFKKFPNDNKSIDFIFEVDNTEKSRITNKVFDESVSDQDKCHTLREFLNYNPCPIIKEFRTNDGRTIYFGKIITQDLLDNLSKKVNAEIAIIRNNSPVEVSNESVNSQYSYLIGKASKVLSGKNNFDMYSVNTSSDDILATIYKPGSELTQQDNLQFLIFASLNQANDLISNLKYFLMIIGFAGVMISLILSILFTDKIRKQISQLSEATKVTKDGNFMNKIEVKSNDELGQLGNAFNKMLDELQKNEIAKNEYSEFITLLNQSPTLKEISEASLQKIISTCGFAVGALYIVEKDEILLQVSYGLEKTEAGKINSQLFDTVIKNQDTLELYSEEKLPVVSAGSILIEIRSLLIIPIVYSGKVISILELGSFSKPSKEAKEYLDKIKYQLAIGLTNASAVAQLENLITELKTLNEDYQKQNDQIKKQNDSLVELHKRLKEKADELEIQKKKAEESTKLKSQFLASMSHELRTPMNSILGLTELMIDDKNLAEKNRERMDVVLRSGRRLMSLINGILDLSKIEAGKMEVRNEEVLIEELLKEVENYITPLIEKKELTFKIVRKFNTRSIINSDRNKVTQVLLNLLDNAVKFTNYGFVEMHVSSADNFIYFDIIDSGIGIGKEDSEIIFEEFRQIDGTNTRKYNGTGLGLAICKRIAGLLNGDLTVKSEPGHGSIFTFSIPFNLISFNVNENPEPADLPQETEIFSVNPDNNKLILVIDANPDVRYTIGKFLTSRGYSVEFATDAADGFEKALKFKPFAISFDILMPQLNGWKLLMRLKGSEETKNIPVIPVNINKEKNSGFGICTYDYLVKPLSFLKIEDILKKLEKSNGNQIHKILLVDDEEGEFESLIGSASNDNIRIDFIKDSELAYSKIIESQPDLVIIDLVMPNVNGVSLTNKLQSNIETKHIPVVLGIPEEFTEDDMAALNATIETITLKSGSHSLDILKIVRDRINLQENENSEEGSSIDIDQNPELELPFADEVKTYHGNVLIVDDDPDTLFTLSEIVQACNCRTITARNGVECLRALEYKIPDLILLDIMMPEMDGFQTISRIKQNPQWAHIPVFAVTAKAMLDDKKVILKHGFDDYIAKPVNSGVLAFKIEKTFTKIKTI